MLEYNNIFELAKSLNANYKPKKFQIGINELKEDIQSGALSIFSGRIDAALSERYAEFRRFGFNNALGKDVDEYKEFNENVNSLLEEVFEQSRIVRKKGIYSDDMINDRMAALGEEYAACVKQYEQGQKEANKKTEKVVEDFNQ